jgi:hypothetical protein
LLHTGSIVFNEQRTSPRKVLKTRAVVTFEGIAPLTVRSADVSGKGICLTSPQPMASGLECELSFDLFLDGKVSTVKTRSIATYCIFSNGEYKIGFQFVNLELAAMTLLAKFLR